MNRSGRSRARAPRVAFVALLIFAVVSLGLVMGRHLTAGGARSDNLDASDSGDYVVVAQPASREERAKAQFLSRATRLPLVADTKAVGVEVVIAKGEARRTTTGGGK